MLSAAQTHLFFYRHALKIKATPGLELQPLGDHLLTPLANQTSNHGWAFLQHLRTNLLSQLRQSIGHMATVQTALQTGTIRMRQLLPQPLQQFMNETTEQMCLADTRIIRQGARMQTIAHKGPQRVTGKGIEQGSTATHPLSGSNGGRLHIKLGHALHRRHRSEEHTSEL